MTMSDPIADMLTRIRNANTAKHDTVDVPSSKMKLAIAQILLDEGYIKKYDIVEDGGFKTIHITLKYGADKNEKIISGIKRISKPGLRVYAGKKLTLNLGYSHPVEMIDPEGIETVVDGQNLITVKGIDKEKVGQFAAEIRDKRRPEPYKGKGIKYADETIRRKVGKTGKK